VAGLSAEVRDLAQVATGLPEWWAHTHPEDEAVQLSALSTNPASGYSSESLLFDATSYRNGETTTEALVLRLPPAGGGLFPEYDLDRQARTQRLLADAGVPAAAPVTFEPDDRWIGTPFMVMPRIAGRIPGDYTYPRKGWLHDAEPAEQRAHANTFIDALTGLLTLDPDRLGAQFLARREGTGLVAEIGWWADYLDWACDGERHPLMHDAYEWARSTAPADTDRPSITWGDARFANTVFAHDGTVVGMLDWEQAAVGPAELDIGFWLSSRRQAREAVGVTVDPELPGFPDRSQVLARLEAQLGRPLRALGWHEAFAMVRMGTCIVSTQALLRRAGMVDHPFISSAPLPDWTIEVVAGVSSWEQR
jgi:aminoglycoside phosphotransferase (APT) family kinase protein